MGQNRPVRHRVQLTLLLIGPLLIALAADLSLHRLIYLQKLEAEEVSESQSELTAYSLRAVLGRIEEEHKTRSETCSTAK